MAVACSFALIIPGCIKTTKPAPACRHIPARFLDTTCNLSGIRVLHGSSYQVYYGATDTTFDNRDVKLTIVAKNDTSIIVNDGTVYPLSYNAAYSNDSLLYYSCPLSSSSSAGGSGAGNAYLRYYFLKDSICFGTNFTASGFVLNSFYHS